MQAFLLQAHVAPPLVVHPSFLVGVAVVFAASDADLDALVCSFGHALAADSVSARPFA